MLRRQHIWQIDWFLVAITVSILLIGAAFVWSASYYSRAGGEGYYHSMYRTQFIWFGLGVVACIAMVILDYHKLLKFADAFYLFGIVLLIVVLANVVTDRFRWIRLGPVRFQPSEFMKIAIILLLAKYVPTGEQLKTFRGWIVPIILSSCPLLLILRQPNLATAVVIVPVVLAVLFVAGARPKHFIILGLVCLTAAPVGWYSLKEYQKHRVVSFVWKGKGDSHAEMNELYQIIQAETAVGAGGWFGRGWGKGTQNRLNFLPRGTKPTDFIMAVIAEEAGFIGACSVLLLFFILFLGCLGIADQTRDPQGKAIVVGVVALLATQVFVNAGVATGLLPTTGIPMPFVSYGGSSTLASFMMLGLVINVGLRRSSFLAGGDRSELKPLRRVLK